MSYMSSMVANNILHRAISEKNQITPMKLQKILYFVASEYQKATGKPLLIEHFAAWPYGPVAYSVYDEFRAFRSNPIDRYAQDAKGVVQMVDEDKDIHLKESIDRVWNRAKHVNAVKLSEITHNEGSAWDKAYQADNPFIAIEDIGEDKTYYSDLGF